MLRLINQYTHVRIHVSSCFTHASPHQLHFGHLHVIFMHVDGEDGHRKKHVSICIVVVALVGGLSCMGPSGLDVGLARR